MAKGKAAAGTHCSRFLAILIGDQGQHSKAFVVSKLEFLSLLCSFFFSATCTFISDVYFDVPVLPHSTLATTVRGAVATGEWSCRV